MNAMEQEEWEKTKAMYEEEENDEKLIILNVEKSHRMLHKGKDIDFEVKWFMLSFSKTKQKVCELRCNRFHHKKWKDLYQKILDTIGEGINDILPSRWNVVCDPFYRLDNYGSFFDDCGRLFIVEGIDGGYLISTAVIHRGFLYCPSTNYKSHTSPEERFFKNKKSIKQYETMSLLRWHKWAIDTFAKYGWYDECE